MSEPTSHLASIRLDAITAHVEVRKRDEAGLKRLEQSIRDRGYLDRYPVAVTPAEGGGYKLLDGNHREEVCRRLGRETIWAQVYEHLTSADEYRIAYQSNASHDSIVRQEWTDDAEFVWTLAGGGKTQQEIAEIVGWSQQRVGQFASLKQIADEAWRVIVTTTKASLVVNDEDDVVVAETTVVVRVFNERLLRLITSLQPEQQLKLVKDLAAGRIDKAKFKAQAERYRARNALLAEAERRLRDLPEEYLARATAAIEQGTYDREWLENRLPGPAFENLIQSLRDEHDKKQNYRLFTGDFVEVCNRELAGASVDVIITDPPYGKDYLPLYGRLAEVAARVLKPGGSLIVMTGQSYLPEILALMTPHMRYHWMAAYLTPGGQAVQVWQREVNTFWKPLLWFVKGDRDAARWAGDVCRSAVNDNDKRFHNWGQSETGMRDVIERFTTAGETILDPFCGGGTTLVVANALGRKSIGIDHDADCIQKAIARLQEPNPNE